MDSSGTFAQRIYIAARDQSHRSSLRSHSPSQSPILEFRQNNLCHESSTGMIDQKPENHFEEYWPAASTSGWRRQDSSAKGSWLERQSFESRQSPPTNGPI